VPARGDIALARFPFTDGTFTKLRPVLILAAIPGRHADYLVLFISSQLSHAQPGLDLILDAGHPAFAASGLRRPSVFRVAKVASMSGALLVGRLGALRPDLLDQVVGRLVRLLRSGV
jgi:mRNA interferase MazF